MLDPLIEIAKHAPTSKSKSDWYQEIFKRSELQRPVGESQEVAFARYVTKSEEGRVLFNAHYHAPGPDWQPPVKITKAEVPHQTEAMTGLEKLAEEVRANNPKLTTAQAFSKALQTPEGQELYRQDKSQRLGTAVAWGRV
jgi:hypothetical protein